MSEYYVTRTLRVLFTSGTVHLSEEVKKCQCVERHLCNPFQQSCVSNQQSMLPEDGESPPPRHVAVLVKCNFIMKCAKLVKVLNQILKEVRNE
jgi:hypothetical protein